VAIERRAHSRPRSRVQRLRAFRDSLGGSKLNLGVKLFRIEVSKSLIDVSEV